MGDDDIARLRRSGDVAAKVQLADLLVASGRPNEAVTACHKALQRRPDEAQLHLALGRALSAAGALERAQAAFRVAKALLDSTNAAPTRLPPPPSPDRFDDPADDEVTHLRHFDRFEQVAAEIAAELDESDDSPEPLVFAPAELPARPPPILVEGSPESVDIDFGDLDLSLSDAEGAAAPDRATTTDEIRAAVGRSRRRMFVVTLWIVFTVIALAGATFMVVSFISRSR